MCPLDAISKWRSWCQKQMGKRKDQLQFSPSLIETHLPPSSTWWVGFNLKDRVSLFAVDIMVEESLVSAVNNAIARSRRRRRDGRDTVEKQARRVFHTVQLVTAGRQALEGAAVAPGKERTLSA